MNFKRRFGWRSGGGPYIGPNQETNTNLTQQKCQTKGQKTIESIVKQGRPRDGRDKQIQKSFYCVLRRVCNSQITPPPNVSPLSVPSPSARWSRLAGSVRARPLRLLTIPPASSRPVALFGRGPATPLHHPRMTKVERLYRIATRRVTATSEGGVRAARSLVRSETLW